MSGFLESLKKPETAGLVIDYAGILEILPHRFPFLLVDGITAIEPEKSITGFKNVSFNEPFFDGHFPGNPVMPGVLQIEALAQVACILVLASYWEELKGKRPAFAGIEQARFRRPVRPGHVLVLKATLEKYRKGFAVLNATAEVGDQLVAEAVIKASMV